MKMVLYIAILAGLAGASYWLLSHDAEQERKELAMQYQRMQEANEKRQEQTRQEERKEAESKDQAVKMLNAYLNRETQRLNKIVEECKIHMEQIELDQKDLSEAIAEIETENERRAENYRKRGKKRFDKAERVSLILKNPIMNAMAEKYTGENLNATYAKYKSEMSTELKRYQESEARLRKNRENYYKTVAGLNEEVERRNANARRRNDSAAHETELQLKMLQKRRKPLADKRDMLIKQLAQMKNPHHEKQLEALNKQIEPLDEQIASVQALLTTVRAQTAHMEATEAVI